MSRFLKIFINLFLIFLLSGCQSFHRTGKATSQLEKHQFQHITYVDKSGKQLLVKYDTISDTVTITVETSLFTLEKSLSASGAKYSRDSYVFWNKGKAITFIKGDTLLFRGEERP